MPERDDDPRAGVVFGLLAGAMVIALTVMAFNALAVRAPPMRMTADVSFADIEAPRPPADAAGAE